MGEWSVETPETFWRFGSGDFRMKWGSYEEVLDPFPGYRHDIEVVEKALAECVRVAPMPHPGCVWLPAHDMSSRTNGWASYESAWVGEGDDQRATWTHHIVLAGKRIPIHPAVTRYVVPHEYAHALLFEAAAQQGEWDTDDLRRQYAEIRGIPWHPKATGGTWHKAIEEVAACDFRMLICRAEIDYWPHRGIPGPWSSGKSDALDQWWRDLIDRVNGDRELEQAPAPESATA